VLTAPISLQGVLGFVFLLVATTGPLCAGAADMNDLNHALLRAAAENDSTGIAELISRGAEMEFRDDRGRTSLLIATHHNAVEAARVLILAGADVNAADDIQDTPYLYAGAEGRLEILRMTLDHGADLKSVNRYGGTALIPAAHHGHVDTVRELLNTAMDIDHINNLGWTALLEAVILGDGSDTYVEIVRLLVDAGADPSIGDREGVTPLQHARASGYGDIVETLENGGQHPVRN
jgi:ankyrin repeat protein